MAFDTDAGNLRRGNTSQFNRLLFTIPLDCCGYWTGFCFVFSKLLSDLSSWAITSSAQCPLFLPFCLQQETSTGMSWYMSLTTLCPVSLVTHTNPCSTQTVLYQTSSTPYLSFILSDLLGQFSFIYVFMIYFNFYSCVCMPCS